MAMGMSGDEESVPAATLDELLRLMLLDMRQRDAAASKPARPSPWDVVQKAANVFSAVSGLVILIVGFQLKDRLELTLKQDELQITSATDMRDVEASALKVDAQKTDVLAAALSLAAYRDYALPFFVQLAMLPNTAQRDGARAGLRAVGLVRKDATCDCLAAVLRDRSRLYGWEASEIMASVSADVNCQQNLAAMTDYRALVGSWASDRVAFARVVDNSPALDNATASDLTAQLDDAIARLHAQPTKEASDVRSTP